MSWNILYMSMDSARVQLNGLVSHVLEHPVYEYGQRYGPAQRAT
jgi:hypothetical protein